MLLAESAVLLCFHTVRMSFLVLRHVVVALFAFCTCQCNLCAHDFHLHLNYRSSHLPLRYLILSIKKRPKLFHSPVYYTIEISIRQGIFVDLWGLAVGFMGAGSRIYGGWPSVQGAAGQGSLLTGVYWFRLPVWISCPAPRCILKPSLSMSDEYGHKIYVLCTGFSEGPRARFNGTACGIDIVHQYNIIYTGRQGGCSEGLLQVL